MTHALSGFLLALSVIPAGVTYAALIGLGLHRHAPPAAISLAATAILFGPPLAGGALAAASRVRVFAAFLAAWSAVLFLALPVYFPGERAPAVATGLALLGGDDAARLVADRLPSEPVVAHPELPEAAAVVEADLPPPPPLKDHQISLPYEGEGRRLSVPVAFEHGGRTREATMMLDTGATYTTLPTSVLEELGIAASPGDPVVTLHTANGVREARIVLIDRIWLGDLAIDAVAVATCDGCGSGDNDGLLGLNVSGGYNLLIDADRKEVVFTSRARHDRHLDLSPFLELAASFSRFRGGRVEVEVEFGNTGGRDVGRAVAEVRCGPGSWSLEAVDVPAGERVVVRRRLPPHEACERYEVSLAGGAW